LAFVRLLISGAVLALLFSRFAPDDVLAGLLRARAPWLAAGLAAYMTAQAVSAVRWHRIARSVGFTTPFVPCLRFYWIGMFFGLAVPSTIGADGARALLLGREPPGRARALSTVVFDRLIGLAMLFAVAVLALLLGPSGTLPRSVVATVAAVGSTLVLAWAMTPRLARLLPTRSRLRRLADEDLAPFFHDRRLLTATAALSLAVHALQIVAQKFLTEALGLDVSWGFVAIYHPLVALAAAVPLTVGGFGLREATYAYLLPHVGVGPDEAIALGLLWWAVGALAGLVGGVIYGLGGDRVRP
jgi:glycosyltransferase 2 family protein